MIWTTSTDEILDELDERGHVPRLADGKTVIAGGVAQARAARESGLHAAPWSRRACQCWTGNDGGIDNGKASKIRKIGKLGKRPR